MNFYVDKLTELKEAQARNNEESEERKLQTKNMQNGKPPKSKSSPSRNTCPKTKNKNRRRNK